jgi:hypothetical protein
MFRKFWIIFYCIFFIQIPVLALEFDTSIDEEIKKKYNTSQIEYDVLPNLPKINNSTTVNTIPKTTPVYSAEKPTITIPTTSNSAKIPYGTKFQVKSNQTISNKTREGATVTFTSTSNVYKKDISIPTGTKFYGTVVSSHNPQITGNGGQFKVKVNSISYNGKNYSIDGKITKANSKKIFLNNVKGKHQYWKGVANQVNKGEKFYQKTRTISSKMANNPIGSILSPIPTVVGYAGYAICTVASPITGLTYKGGSISIPANSQYEIKLTKKGYVN